MRPDLADLGDGSLLEILARGKYGDQATYDALKKKLGRRPEEDYWKGKRPEPGASEDHVRAVLGAKKTRDFKDGVKAGPSTQGSVRPDHYEEKENVFGETKNIDIENRDSVRGLRARVKKQAIERDANLPPGSRQKIYQDVRGQRFKVEELDKMADKLSKATGGIIPKGRIRYIIGDLLDDWLEYE